MISIKQGATATPSRFTPSRAAAAIGGVAVFWAGVVAVMALLFDPTNAIAVVSGIAGFWGGMVVVGAVFMMFAAARKVLQYMEKVKMTHFRKDSFSILNLTDNVPLEYISSNPCIQIMLSS